MTALELYKFINGNILEIDWRGEELMLWVDFDCLHEFAKLIKAEWDDEITLHLHEYGVATNLIPICEAWDIDPEEILKKGATA